LTSLAFLAGTQFTQQLKTSQQLLQGIQIHPVANDVSYPYVTYMANDLQKKLIYITVTFLTSPSRRWKMCGMAIK
jgi:hypothetical protein